MAKIRVLLAAGALLTTSCAQAQQTSAPNAFPFVIPWDDTKQTLLDVSFLNEKPAGKNGFVVARDGQFVQSKTAKPLRFLGVNFTFGAPFPSKSEAEKVAARMAKYGFNLVRIHYIDGSWYSEDTIWNPASKNFQTLDKAKLDQLDYLIAQFKKHGIYTNINLKVARNFMPEDGFPASAKELPWMSKRIDFFNRRMIDLQKKYARDLLGRTNPYTKTRYADEPAIFALEINNENSPSMWDDGRTLTTLPQPFRGDVQTAWNNWLARRYASTQQMLAAWNKNLPAPGPDVLREPAKLANWETEIREPAKMTTSTENGALKFEIAQKSDQAWHAQIKQTGLTLQNDAVYTLKFRAKADGEHWINFGVSRDRDDWRSNGLMDGGFLSTQWRDFEFVFRTRDALPGQSRLNFEMGSRQGTVWISDIQLFPGAQVKLPAGQNLEARNIALEAPGGGQRRADWISFLGDVEINYTREMRDFLKKTLKMRQMVINTQLDYGQYTGVYREAQNDYSDLHLYWDHPMPPGGDYSKWGLDNTMLNKPMTPKLGNGDMLTHASTHHVAGKPLMISEWNHPAPNEFAAEGLPLISSIAARQNWSGIVLHEYGAYGDGAQNNRIQHYFAVAANPEKWAFGPATALIFRQGLISPAATRTVATMPATLSNDPKTQISVAEAWKQRDTTNKIFNERLALALGSTPPDRLKTKAANSSLRVLKDNGDDATARFVADAPAAKIVTGLVANKRVETQGATFTFGAAPNNFAALTATALDAKPLRASAKILITTASRVQNTGFKWQTDKIAVQNWGEGPTLAEIAPVEVQLQVDGPRHVWTLNQSGAPQTRIVSTQSGSTLSFKIEPSHKTLWFAVVRP
jgi:hypothetical protein